MKFFKRSTTGNDAGKTTGQGAGRSGQDMTVASEPTAAPAPVAASATPRRTRKRNEAQLRYLSQAVILEETSGPRFLAATAIIASLSVAAFIGWSSIATINEVSRATGEVVPNGFEQVVQHMDGGIIKDIRVVPGDLVEKGQVLVTLDDGTTRDTLERERAKRLFLQLAAHRLRATFAGRRPDFAKLSDARAEDIAAQIDLYDKEQEEIATRRQIVEEQIRQKQQDISIVESQLAAARKSLEGERALLASRNKLNTKGLLTRTVMIRTQQGVIRLEGEVAKLDEKAKQAVVALDEFRQRRQAIDKAYRLETSSKLNATHTELRQLDSAIELLEARFDRLDLRAPVRGLVKTVNVTTVGGVLGAGQTVLSIVPVDDELVADAQIRPQDIGHVRPGMNVNVKVSAYDYSRYGIIEGTLEHISATTFTMPNGGRYYRGRIRLHKTHVGNNPEKNLILPGMTVMADILTGEKTILDYLLKPVRNAAASAFSER